MVYQTGAVSLIVKLLIGARRHCNNPLIQLRIAMIWCALLFVFDLPLCYWYKLSSSLLNMRISSCYLSVARVCRATDDFNFYVRYAYYVGNLRFSRKYNRSRSRKAVPYGHMGVHFAIRDALPLPLINEAHTTTTLSITIRKALSLRY